MDEQAKILICHADLAPFLEQLGFRNVHFASTVENGLERVRTEEDFDWIIAPLAMEYRIGGLHLAHHLHKTNSAAKLSLLYEPGEEMYVIRCFEWGALSCHKSPMSLESMRHLCDLLNTPDFDEVLTAADYLRPILTKERQWTGLTELSQKLCDLYPDNPDLKLHLAQAQFLEEDHTGAMGTLTDIAFMHPERQPEIDALTARYLPVHLVGQFTSRSLADQLGLKHLVVVDPDSQIQQQMWSLVAEIGVPRVEVFGDIESALPKIEDSGQVDLIIQEWKLPTIGGKGLVQRVREQGLMSVPIILLTDSVQEEDYPLLHEMGIAAIFKKPVEKDALKDAIIKTLREERSPTKKRLLLRKITTSLEEGELAKAKGFRKKLFATTPVTIADREHVAAAFLHAEGQYSLARDMATNALQAGGDRLLLLNLLARIFTKLGDIKQALRCLHHAQKMSPKNVGRFCSIAHLEMERDHLDHAEDALKKARALDPSNRTVRKTRAKLAVAKGEHKKVKEMVGDDFKDIISYINQKAIGYSAKGKYNLAENLYERSLTLLPPERKSERASLLYNLALAAVRGLNYPLAFRTLEQCMRLKVERVEKKAESLYKRLREAIRQNKRLQVSPAVAPEPPEASEPEEGEALHHLISEPHQQGVTGLFKGVFAPRLEAKLKRLLS